MKKILSIILAVMMIFGCISVVAFAGGGEETSKTEAFIAALPNGFKVKTDGKITIDAAVKGDKAVFDVTLGPINAKAFMDGDNVTAYMSPFFKADISSLIKDVFGMDFKASDLTSMVNKISEIDLSGVTKYCKVSFVNNVEKFEPDMNKIAEEFKPVLAAQIEDEAARAYVDGLDTDAFIEYLDNLKPGDDGYDEYQNCKKCGGEVTFTGSDAKTITNVVVSIPSDDFKTVNTQQLSDFSYEGIRIKSISVDISDKDLKQPIGIFDVTWFLKLVINFVISKVG